MGEVYGSRLGALEIGPDGSVAAVYPDSREELFRPAAAARAVAPARDPSRRAYASR